MKKYSLLATSLIAIVGSLVVNALLVTVFFPLTDVPAGVMTFRIIGPTGAFTILGALGGAIVFLVLRHFSKNPNRIFVIISAIVLLLSLIPDLLIHSFGPMFAQVTPGGIALLMSMHVACALVTVSALTLLTKPTRQEQA